RSKAPGGAQRNPGGGGWPRYPGRSTGGIAMDAARVVFLLTSLGLALALAAAPAAGRAEEDEDARLAARFKAYLDEELRQRPYAAPRRGAHRYDDRLDDLSPKARAAWVEHWRSTLADLEKSFDPKKLSRAGQIDLEIFKHDLKRALWLSENT